MAIQTQVVAGRLSQADGQPIGSGYVRFILSAFDATENGVIAAAEKIDAQIESDGSIAPELWPNTAGLKGTRYTVLLLDEKKNRLEHYGQISVGTDGPYSLADLLQANLPPATTSYWMSLTEAEFAAKIAQMDARVSTAETARDIATGARDTTIAARDATEGYKNAAYANAQDVASAIVYQNLAGVMASYNLNIVDAFVYDTTRDFMGGLWRYQCQGKSWFDEEGAATGRWLGAQSSYAAAVAAGGEVGDYYLAGNGNFYKLISGSDIEQVYRGSRKDHPANAIITAEAGRAVIWDGDDPSLPMWDVLADTGTGVNTGLFRGGINGNTGVAALNGIYAISKDGDYSSDGALSVVDFVKDRGVKHSGTSNFCGFINGIAYARNTPLTLNTGIVPPVASKKGYDVAITTLPGAPIDPETGMPRPTIAVATDGGVSVIRDDGTVVDSGFALASNSVAFLGDSLVYGASVYDRVYVTDNIRDAENSFPAHRTYKADSVPAIHAPDGNKVGVCGSDVVSYSLSGLVRIAENLQTPANGMVAYTAHDYATGWMLDPKGCWLASTDASDLVGGSPINESFSTYTNKADAVAANWETFGVSSATNTSWDIVSGTLQVSRGSGSVEGRPRRVFTGLTIGKRYRITIDMEPGTWVIENSNAGLGQTANVSSAVKSFEFVANATSFACSGWPQNPNSTVTINGIYLDAVDPDRSVNGKGLVVQNTITRTPVATGSELMGYGNFHIGKMQREVTPPGLGDFCLMGWGINTNTLDCPLALEDPNLVGSGLVIASHYNTSPFAVFTGRGGSNNQKNFGTKPTPLGSWFFFYVGRKDGAWYGGVNGETHTSTGLISTEDLSAATLVNVGRQGTITGGAWGGRLALLRYGHTCPTPEQIAKIYRDEKPLFQPGAACTLWGDSDAVADLDGCDIDGLKRVVTSGAGGGLSRFDGLLRVSHDPEPSTLIACGAGYEVTQ
ncbi:hypothetical protein [Sulfitobacter sp. SH24]|uniref:hypothetical protein n=1 Tax=Sulfitobacter sp. SH24 TaxID=3421173 RepID=UPI003F4FF90C